MWEEDNGYVVNENEGELKVDYAESETNQTNDDVSENSENDLCTDESLDMKIQKHQQKRQTRRKILKIIRRMVQAMTKAK